MASLLILLMIIVVPTTVLADCIITDTPYKFEVVCSGSNEMSAPINSKKSTKIAKRSSKATKVTYGSRKIATVTYAMNEEELKYMQTRNRQDGYRAKRKPKEQITTKLGAG